MALFREIWLSNAAEPPATLSRPIMAASIMSPEARSTTREITPSWGK
jgi:hypothetical protein